MKHNAGQFGRTRRASALLRLRRWLRPRLGSVDAKRERGRRANSDILPTSSKWTARRKSVLRDFAARNKEKVATNRDVATLEGSSSRKLGLIPPKGAEIVEAEAFRYQDPVPVSTSGLLGSIESREDSVARNASFETRLVTKRNTLLNQSITTTSEGDAIRQQLHFGDARSHGPEQKVEADPQQMKDASSKHSSSPNPFETLNPIESLSPLPLIANSPPDLWPRRERSSSTRRRPSEPCSVQCRVNSRQPRARSHSPRSLMFVPLNAVPLCTTTNVLTSRSLLPAANRSLESGEAFEAINSNGGTLPPAFEADVPHSSVTDATGGGSKRESPESETGCSPKGNSNYRSLSYVRIPPSYSLAAPSFHSSFEQDFIGQRRLRSSRVSVHHS
jgi:hypothetical protein